MAGFFLLISLVWCLSVVRSHYEPFGENVAIRKPANQSTTYSENGFMYNASLGVDGWISTDFRSKTCSHTNELQTNAWWTVNLLGFYLIKFIRIYQRTYDVIELNRLVGSEMYGRLEDHTWQRIYFNSTMPPVVFNVSVNLEKPVSEIMLNTSKKPDAFMSVCELEAFEVIVCSNYSIGNGSIKVVQYGDSNQTFTYGTKLNVTCHEGYKISVYEVVANETENNLECNATGDWSRNLSCTVTDCGWPPNITNNSKQTLIPGIAGNTTYNATLTVECNEGYNYSLQETGTLRCVNHGLWAGELGNCNAIECFIIFTIDNGEIKVKATGVDGKNNTYGVKLSVECDSGFTSNVLEITCLDSGISSKPVCSADPEATDLIATIVGSVVTFITAVVLVVGIIIFMRRRTKHKDDETENFDQIDERKVGGSITPAEMDIQKGLKKNTRNNIPDPTIAHKVIASGHNYQAKEERSAYEFVEDFDMEDIKSKSIGLDNNAIEPYDTLQMDNIAKSEYNELNFERESSLETTMKDEPYQNMRQGN